MPQTLMKPPFMAHIRFGWRMKTEPSWHWASFWGPWKPGQAPLLPERTNETIAHMQELLGEAAGQGVEFGSSTITYYGASGEFFAKITSTETGEGTYVSSSDLAYEIVGVEAVVALTLDVPAIAAVAALAAANTYAVRHETAVPLDSCTLVQRVGGATRRTIGRLYLWPPQVGQTDARGHIKTGPDGPAGESQLDILNEKLNALNTWVFDHTNNHSIVEGWGFLSQRPERVLDLHHKLSEPWTLAGWEYVPLVGVAPFRTVTRVATQRRRTAAQPRGAPPIY